MELGLKNKIIPTESEPKAQRGKIKDNNKKSIFIKILDAILYLSLFMNLLGAPLFFTGLTFQGMVFEKTIYFYFWTLLGLVAWVSRDIKLGELKIKRTFLDIPIVLFLIVYLLSAIFSVDRWHSFIGSFGDPSRGFLSILAIIITYYIIVSNFTPRLFRWMLGGLIFSSVFISARALLGFFNVNFLPAKIASHIPLNLIGSMDSLGVFTSLLIPILVMMILKIQSEETKSKISKNVITGLLLILLAVYLFIAFSIYSYVAWPGILIGMGIFLIYILARIVNVKDSWSWLPMLTFVTIIIFLMIGSVKIIKTNLPVSVSVPLKASLEIAKKSMQEKTFLGYGPGNYGVAYSKNLPAGFDSKGLRLFQGQGFLFESISTIGIVGLVFLVILILTFLGASFFLISRNKNKDRLYSLGMLATAIVILADAVLIKIDAPIFIIGSIIIALTVAIVLKENDVEENFISLSVKASPKYALALGFVFLLVVVGVAYAFIFVGKIYFADMKMGKAVAAESNISEIGSIASAISATNLNNREGRYFTRLGQEYMLLANNEIKKGSSERDINKIQTYLNSAIDAGKRGEAMMVQDVTAIEALAQIYENTGSYIPDTLNLSLDEYNKASQLEPQNPDFYVKLGQIKIKIAGTKKDEAEKKQLIEDAKNLFQSAINIRDNYAPAYYNRALVEEALGQTDVSISDLEKAVTLDRRNADYVFNLARVYVKRGSDNDNQIAEALYKKILAADPNNINTHFSLGLLYEKTKRLDDAVSEYKKVLSLLPAGSEKIAESVNKMISNVAQGISNLDNNQSSNKQ